MCVMSAVHESVGIMCDFKFLICYFNLNIFYSEILLKLENGFFFFPSGVGNGNPFPYCLENPRDRGDWQATAHRVTESDMTERLTLSLSSLHNRGKDA